MLHWSLIDREQAKRDQQAQATAKDVGDGGGGVENLPGVEPPTGEIKKGEGMYVHLEVYVYIYIYIIYCCVYVPSNAYMGLDCQCVDMSMIDTASSLYSHVGVLSHVLLPGLHDRSVYQGDSYRSHYHKHLNDLLPRKGRFTVFLIIVKESV